MGLAVLKLKYAHPAPVTEVFAHFALALSCCVCCSRVLKSNKISDSVNMGANVFCVYVRVLVCVFNEL